MLTAVYATVAIAALLILALVSGRLLDLVLFTFFASLVISPLALYRFESYTSHVGISPGTPTIFTYTVVLILFLGWCCATGRMPFDQRWIPFVLGCLIFMLFVWNVNSVTLSGCVHLLTGALAAGMGYVLAAGAYSQRFRESLARVILLISSIEFAVCVSQLFGVSNVLISQFSVNSTTAETTAGRIAGTTDHPGTLGKVAFLLIILSLPLFGSSSSKIRRSAQISTALLALPLVFSEGRANFAAVIALFVAWPIVSAFANSRSRNPGANRRFVFAVAAVLVALGSFGIYAARFDEDPAGGPRDRLLTVAYEQIPLRLFSGTGPNSYVDVVGRFDALTARGWPVHSVPLLAIGELGILVASLLLLPVLLLTLRSIALAAGPFSSKETATVWLSSLPGIAIISITGWGFLSGPVFVLLCFVLGVFSANLGSRWLERKSTSVNLKTDRAPLFENL
ncbi:hypothetical protein [Rhodococcoides fascians]|uniref:hypothetical protein n=1 Tax=Rhodococcoides fascians TaxID=1828 RepID=UPI000A9C2968|nr:MULTISPECIES: hypothetical protein [Rhodococcus]